MQVDSSLHGLTRLGVSAADVSTLYRYVRDGRPRDDRGSGVFIGKQVDKSGRTEVHRLLSSVCRGLETKTFGTAEGQVTLCILLHPS